MFKNILIKSPIDYQHPVLQMTLRRVRWWRSPDSLPRYTQRVIAWTMALVVMVFIAFMLVKYALHVRAHASATYFSTWSYLDDVLVVLAWSAGISIGLSYLLDFLIIAFTINTINGEHNANRWDLLQLTLLPPQSIIESLYHSNQMRVWRMTMVVIGTRIALAALFWLDVFLVYPVFNEENIFENIVDAMLYEPLFAIVIAWFGALFTGLFIVEPVWRVRSTTALALAISSHVKRLVTAISLAFPLLLTIWIGLLALLFGLGWATFYIGSRLDAYNYYNATGIFVTIALNLGIFMGYGYFRLVRRLSLRWALRRSVVHRTQWNASTADLAIPRFSWRHWWLPNSSLQHDNHIFQYNVQDIKWWTDRRSPLQVNRRMMWWTVATVLLLFVIPVAAVLFLVTSNDFGHNLITQMGIGTTRGNNRILDFVESGYGLAIGFAFVLIVVLDFITIMNSVNAVHRARLPAQHDLITLSPISSERVLQAYRAYARTRTWWLTSFVAAFHLTLLMIAFLYIPLESVLFQSQVFNPIDITLIDLIVVCVIFLLAIFTIPLSIYWRTRGLATITVTLALRFTSYAVAWGGAVILLLVMMSFHGVIAWVWWQERYIDEQVIYAGYLASFCAAFVFNWLGVELSRRFLRYQLAEEPS